MNVLEILLAVKSQGDGAIARISSSMDKFTDGLKGRWAEMQRFNKSISNGEAALQKWAGVAAAAFSGGALAHYMREAEEADKITNKLVRSLEKTGQTAFLPALQKQQAALQKVTNASDEQIATVQRLLNVNGLSGEQTLAMTESVLDFAEATGQSFESAGALVGRTLSDNGEEIGRYNIKLDQSKDRATALREALERYAGGQARAAVVDGQARAAKVALGEAGERLGRALNSTLGPVLEAFVPLVEWLVEKVEKLLDYLRPVIGEIARVAAGFVAFASVMAGLKFAMNGVLTVLNPLRAGFVLLSGVNFATLNQFTREIGTLQTMQLATWGQRAAAGLSLVAAALAGWELGSIIKELDVDGLKIEDWVARMMNVWGGWADYIAEAAKAAWVLLKYNFLEKLTEAEIMVKQWAVTVAEVLNKILPKKLELPVEGLKQSIADAQKKLAGLNADEVKALAVIGQQIQKDEADRAWMDQRLDDNGRRDLAARNNPAAAAAANTPPPGPPPGPSREELEAEQKRRIFALETQILQARIAGKQAKADELQLQLDEINLTSQVGEKHKALVKDRLAATTQLRDQERSRAEEERLLTEQLGDIAQRRALIEADRYLTEEEKQRQIVPLLQEENRLIAARIALLEQELLLGATDERRGQILQKLEELRNRKAGNTAEAAGLTDDGFLGGMQQGFKSYIDSVGSLSQQTARAVQSVWGATATGIQNSLMGVITRTMTLGQGLRNIAISFGQSMLESFSKMLADYAMKKAAMFAIDMLYNAKSLAMSLASAAKSLVAWLPSAIAASISSWGVAAALGVAAVVAAVAMKGFADGGPTGSGPRHKPVGIVHAGEWVAPAWMVSDPRYAAVIQMLEGARTGTPGYSLGGFVKNYFKWGGLPKWMWLGHVRRDLEKNNLVDGTNLYGQKVPNAFVTDSDAASRQANFAMPGAAAAEELAAINRASSVGSDFASGASDSSGGGAVAPNITVVNVQDEITATRVARRGAAAGDIVYIVRNNKAAIFGQG